MSKEQITIFMELRPTFGINQLLFGMRNTDVLKMLSQPDRKEKDEEDNDVWIYNALHLKLTFYKEEDFKLAYISCSHPELAYRGKRIIHQPIHTVIHDFGKQIKWDKEAQPDFSTIYFNEDSWLMLHVHYEKVTNVELGAVTKNLDEFDWKF